jgi:hypothetical protein
MHPRSEVKVLSAKCSCLTADHLLSNRRIPAAVRTYCRFNFFPLLASLIALTMGAAGCNKSASTVHVHGHVTYQGNPLPSSLLTFFPSTGRPVSTNVSNGDYAVDLAPGDYTTTIDVAPEFPPGFKEGDPQPKPKYVLPDEYTTRTKTTLKAIVNTSQDQPIDFELK